ncbi:carboxylic ester hydrolase [Brevundimonas intermedia]|uniref:Carboxylic ester hydrolase n=1 Tax=Brevundimonas intermedia TaxID=74315 RepID=A0ABQ5T7X9_9CAUL|nr:carboxylesterase family protein [Brevundimonas intermedia]GLK48498.1 carboxylic ester hydrolase [Brevundimonas intermedia]
MRLLSLLFASLLLAACATHPGKVDHVRFAPGAERVLAKTEAGTVRGIEGAGVRAFLGVPFAQAPVGDLRWRAPQPVRPWEGVRDATRLGSDCTQAIGRQAILGGGGGLVVGSENCLYLNIYAPAGTTAQPRPVMVYIPGGAFTIGSGANYDPSKLAAEQGRVVVTLNYRLGALGWLAHPQFEPQGEGFGGNFGLMDQQAALQWVHGNIAAFGGDPANVTLFAESAGAWSACYLMASPGSEGLYQRVILQSSGCLEPSSLVSAQDAAATGPLFAERLGCSGSDQVSCLKALPAWRLSRAPSLRAGINGPGSWGPVHTDATVPENPALAIHEGRFTRVPVIVGTNLDEGRLFANEVKDMDRYQKETIWMYGDVGPRVLDRYPVGPDGPAYAIATNFTDQRFACPSQALRRQLSRYVPVWGYEFADRGAPFVLPDWIVGLDLGAYHASELAYVFGTSWVFADVKRLTPEQKALSERMQSLWAGFGQRDFGPDWPRVEVSGPVRVFSPDGDRLDADFFDRHHCDFWDGTPFGAVQ